MDEEESLIHTSLLMAAVAVECPIRCIAFEGKNVRVVTKTDSRTLWKGSILKQSILEIEEWLSRLGE